MNIFRTTFTILSLAAIAISVPAPVLSSVSQCTATSDACKEGASIFNSCSVGRPQADKLGLQACICDGGYLENLVQCLACLEGRLPSTTNTFPGGAQPHAEIEAAVTEYCGLADPETYGFLKNGNGLTTYTRSAVQFWSLSWIGLQT